MTKYLKIYVDKFPCEIHGIILNKNESPHSIMLFNEKPINFFTINNSKVFIFNEISLYHDKNNKSIKYNFPFEKEYDITKIKIIIIIYLSSITVVDIYDNAITFKIPENKDKNDRDLNLPENYFYNYYKDFLYFDEFKNCLFNNYTPIGFKNYKYFHKV